MSKVIKILFLPSQNGILFIKCMTKKQTLLSSVEKIAVEEEQMTTNDPQEDPSLSQLLRPLGKKKVQVIRMVVRLSFGVIILLVLILLLLVLMGHL